MQFFPSRLERSPCSNGRTKDARGDHRIARVAVTALLYFMVPSHKTFSPVTRPRTPGPASPTSSGAEHHHGGSFHIRFHIVAA